jgi:dimethylamine monooxygenase subunit A
MPAMDRLHTPYDGSSPPFHIGVSKIDVSDWIEVDEHLARYLAEKRQLRQAVPEKTFVAEANTAVSQQEVLTLLAEHLPRRFPDTFQFERPVMHIRGSLPLNLDNPEVPPLLTAAQLVQEDLILMRTGPGGWRLAAGSLSFPSSWHLLEKFGRPMAEIHASVPGFGVASRNMSVIQRMFDNMPPEQLYLRWNWGFYDDGALHHPAPGNGTHQFGAQGEVFLRVERQTLRKLPHSGDILFTIRTHLNPLDLLSGHPNRRDLARSLIAQVEAFSEPQLAYKGLTLERDRLLEKLGALSK